MNSPYPRVCFVIPTYNEASNITPLLRQLTDRNESVQVLVVDDNSPDGTADFVREMQAACPRIFLSTGEKAGLGAAYQRGMTIAMDELNADVVMQMDADFSHDPEDAFAMIELIREGADVAIGSRYVAGGSIDDRWGAWRRLLSAGGNWLARKIAGIKDIRDCTAGFRAIRADVLRRADPAHLTVTGYAFQIALLHRLMHVNARIVEHPVHFRERDNGETKLGLSDLLEFFASVWTLRFPSARTFVKFAITGSTGVVVNLGSFQFLTMMDVGKFLASPIAIEISIIWNFFLNNYWTFRHREMIGRKRVRGLTFNAVSLVTLAISFATFLLFSAVFPQWPPIVHQAVAILPSTFFNYFVNSYWTFREG